MDKGKTAEAFVREAYDKGVFHGVYLLAEDGVILSKGAFGTRDPECRLPMQEDTVFEMASVSKHFTATALMLLKKRGLVDIDAPMKNYLPELPEIYKDVTIRQTLNHTGGYPDYKEWMWARAKQEGRIFGTAEVMLYLIESGDKPLFAPGEKMEYCNTGYCLLALLVERVSGVPFDDFIKNEIFVPCGMRSTRAYHRRLNGISIDNYAYGMILDNGKYILPDDTPERDYVMWLDGLSGDGIVNSNIFDMLTWDRAQRSELILTAAEQAEMYTPGLLNDGSPCGYGLGWFVRQEEGIGLVVDHSGGWPGYNAEYLRAIDRDIMLILLIDRTGGDLDARLAFIKGMVDIALGKEPAPLPAPAE